MVSAREFEETSVWSPEEMKSLQASSSEGILFLEGIDRWMSIEVCNWNREGELDCHREDEESQLLERLRNLNITSSDAKRVGKQPEKLKSYDDDHAEHSRGGGYWCGMSMQRNGEYFMHKMHRSYIYTVQRREGLLLLLDFLWLLLSWWRIQEWERRQSAGVEIHSRGRLHWRDMLQRV